jgi:alkylhydroperoxidase/carboxymuconolactone decarboxylase family protein YurZ
MDMNTGNAKKRGRPPIADPAKHRVNFRVTESQRESYRAAAEAAGMTLTAYIESLLDRTTVPAPVNSGSFATDHPNELTPDAAELARSWMSLDPKDRELIASLIRRMID